MNRVLREAARLVVAAVLIVSIGSVGTVFADGDEPATAELRAAPRTVVIGEAVPPSTEVPQAKWLKDDLRLTSGLVDVPTMPEEMELLSDIVTELLSGNVAKFLAENYTRLFSGNAAELLSGNEAELLSGNTVQLFSNINVSISIAESGNNNSTPPPVARQPMLLQQKRPARPDAIHGHGTVQPQSHKTTKSEKKARRAKRRFAALDTNGDGLLSFEELQGHGATDRTVAASERR